jgi:hypothetical protein
MGAHRTQILIDHAVFMNVRVKMMNVNKNLKRAAGLFYFFIFFKRYFDIVKTRVKCSEAWGYTCKN